MKKTGIITMYYKSCNYGGLLQSYALINFIKKIGFESEQICRPHVYNENLQRPIPVKVSLLRLFLRKSKNQTIKLIRWLILNFVSNKLLLRQEKLEEFEKSIPHSESIYTRENISDTIDKYDCFITGSDQVWNMSWYNKEYFLDFVPKTKQKISYAASMPNINLTNIEKETIYKHLLSFDDISTREENTASFLSDLIGREVKHVLDPTLLLDAKDWDKTATEYNIEEKYIFCYFLGNDRAYRNIVKRFAKTLGLKIATFPHLNQVKLNDVGFGDYRIYDAGPAEFVYLIKNAEYVFTDSFHATVFSNLYSVKHYVFSRTGEKMDSRITDLLRMFDNENRFLNVALESVDDYIFKLKDADVFPKNALYEQKKEFSQNYLKKNLDKEKINNEN